MVSAFFRAFKKEGKEKEALWSQSKEDMDGPQVTSQCQDKDETKSLGKRLEKQIQYASTFGGAVFVHT